MMDTKEDNDQKQGCDAKTCDELMAEMKSIHKELEEMHKLLDNGADVPHHRVKRIETSLENVEPHLNKDEKLKQSHIKANKQLEKLEKLRKQKRGKLTIPERNQLGRELHEKLEKIRKKI